MRGVDGTKHRFLFMSGAIVPPSKLIVNNKSPKVLFLY